MMPQDEIRHAAVVSERRLLPEKGLVQPVIQILQHKILAVAGERS